jgi:microcystin-dependent protein
MQTGRGRYCAWVAGLALCLGAVCHAQVPAIINYQGKLTDPGTGDPVTEGAYVLEFRVYDHPTAGSVVWGRSFAVNVIASGQFNVLISDGGVIVSDAPAGCDLREAFNGDVRFLEMAVKSDPAGTKNPSVRLVPRQRLVSAPYAMAAQNAICARALNASDGSPTNAVYVDAVGNVGIGTTLPATALQVNGVVRATRIESTQATGTAPLAVASTTKVTNLNADQLDGNESTAFATAGHTHTTLANSLSITGDLTASGKLKEGGNALIPAGTIVLWNGAPTAVPAGWALCDGNNGTPDLRGRFVVGYDGTNTDYNARAKTGGEKTHTLTTAEMPAHTHSVDDRFDSDSTSYYTGIYGGTDDEGSGDGVDRGYRTVSTTSTGSGGAHENRPPYFVLAYIMKL